MTYRTLPLFSTLGESTVLVNPERLRAVTNVSWPDESGFKVILLSEFDPSSDTVYITTYDDDAHLVMSVDSSARVTLYDGEVGVGVGDFVLETNNAWKFVSSVDDIEDGRPVTGLLEAELELAKQLVECGTISLSAID